MSWHLVPIQTVVFLKIIFLKFKKNLIEHFFKYCIDVKQLIFINVTLWSRKVSQWIQSAFYARYTTLSLSQSLSVNFSSLQLRICVNLV